MLSPLKLFLLLTLFINTSLGVHAENDFRENTKILHEKVLYFDWNFLLNEVLDNNKIEAYLIYLKDKVKDINFLTTRYPRVYEEKKIIYKNLKEDLQSEIHRLKHQKDFSLLNSIETLRSKYQTWVEWFSFYSNKYASTALLVTSAFLLVAGGFYLFKNVFNISSPADSSDLIHIHYDEDDDNSGEWVQHKKS